MSKLKDLSLSDLKSVLDFTDSEISDLTTESVRVGYDHSGTIKSLNEVRDIIRSILIQRVMQIKRME